MAVSHIAFNSLMGMPVCEHVRHELSTYDFGPIVTVKVGNGSKERTFYVHKGLLTHHSSFFRIALKSEWHPGQSGTITLPNDPPDVFQAFFAWLYSGKLYANLTKDGHIPLGNLTICATYVFADARGIPELCNAAIDLLFQKYAVEWSFPNRCLRYVYDNTVADSKLREFFVDLAIETFSFSDAETRQELYPKEFLISVIVQSRSIKAWPAQMGQHRAKFLELMRSALCMYHDHTNPHRHGENLNQISVLGKESQ